MNHTSRFSRWPSIDQLWAIATVTLLALRVQLTPIAPNDFWWHIATGRLIVQHGSVPLVDQFSWTQTGATYVNQPWLAQMLMYAGFRLGGAALLECVQAVLIGATFALLYRVCRNSGAGPRVATLATLAGALVAMDNWQIRPQTYAVPLFVATLALLWTWRRVGRAPLWTLPLLMIAWVNLHGTFTLLPVLCGCFWLGGVVEKRSEGDKETRRQGDKETREQSDQKLETRNLRITSHLSRITKRSSLVTRHSSLFLWSSAALLATVINPRGAGIWSYVRNLIGNQAVGALVTEWASPLRDLQSPMTIVFLLLLALFAALCVWRRQRLAPTHVLLLLPFTLLALQSVRNILWWGIVVAPIAAHLLAMPQVARRHVEIVLMNRLIAGLLALLLLATLPWWKETLGLPPTLGNLLSTQTPVAAVDQMRALPQQPTRLFHEMAFGSYLIWTDPPQPVFVDPRIELYSYTQWNDYILIGQGSNVDTYAQQYGFDGWLISPTNQAGLVAALDHNPCWQRLITTDAAIYFGPRTSTTTAKR